MRRVSRGSAETEGGRKKAQKTQKRKTEERETVTEGTGRKETEGYTEGARGGTEATETENGVF